MSRVRVYCRVYWSWSRARAHHGLRNGLRSADLRIVIAHHRSYRRIRDDRKGTLLTRPRIAVVHDADSRPNNSDRDYLNDRDDRSDSRRQQLLVWRKAFARSFGAARRSSFCRCPRDTRRAIHIVLSLRILAPKSFLSAFDNRALYFFFFILSSSRLICCLRKNVRLIGYCNRYDQIVHDLCLIIEMRRFEFFFIHCYLKNLSSSLWRRTLSKR